MRRYNSFRTAAGVIIVFHKAHLGVLFLPSLTARERELAKFDENRRAVGMLNATSTYAQKRMKVGTRGTKGHP